MAEFLGLSPNEGKTLGQERLRSAHLSCLAGSQDNGDLQPASDRATRLVVAHALYLPGLSTNNALRRRRLKGLPVREGWRRA